MRALVQRVLNASVDAEIDDTTIRAGEIEKGLLVLLGITHTDTEVTAKKMAEKIWNLRIMEDENGVMKSPSLIPPRASCSSANSRCTAIQMPDAGLRGQLQPNLNMPNRW